MTRENLGDVSAAQPSRRNGPSRLIAVVGATGTGKSEFALELAEALAARGRMAEIVNADAMQLYRGMNIGTAKLAASERRGIPHHMLDVLEVVDEASVADYQRAAREVVADIQHRCAVPILVGGSGLYVSSVLFDLQFPGTEPTVRARLEAELLTTGPGTMYERLRSIDERAAAAIGAHNGRRIVRALEVNEITGAPFVSGLPDESAYWTPTEVIGLSCPRAELVVRLDERVCRMWRDGLVDEVASLLPLGLADGITASRAIGYSQAISQLHGVKTEAEAVTQTQALTRRYARRQVSWFRRYPGAKWVDRVQDDSRAAVIAEVLAATL